MRYRVLVDENTSPTVADLLQDAGHDAIHVSRAFEFGASDAEIVEYARSQEAVVLTHDSDFLRPDVASGVPILYYADDSLGSTTIDERVDELASLVPDSADLPPITNLGDWR